MDTKVTWYLSQTLKTMEVTNVPLAPSLVIHKKNIVTSPESWRFLNTTKQKWHDYLGDDEMFCTKPCFCLHAFNLPLELTTPFPKASPMSRFLCWLVSGVSTRDRTWESTAIFGEFGTVRHEVLRGNHPCVVEVGGWFTSKHSTVHAGLEVWKENVFVLGIWVRSQGRKTAIHWEQHVFVATIFFLWILPFLTQTL